MIKKLIFMIFIFIAINMPAAGNYNFGSDHTGRYCAACHEIGACSGNCHISEDSVSYVGVHLNPTICTRCHGEKVTNPDVHAVHKGKICSTCHSSAGWNSTIAKIPPSGSIDSMVIPKSKECGYCHGFNNDRRLHGIHTPFLVEEKCPKCHGQVNPRREEILRITGKEPRGMTALPDSLDIGLKPEVKEVVMAPVNILTDFFNSIANAWMEILKV